MKARTIKYLWDTLEEATACYDASVDRLEDWKTRYPQYSYKIEMLTDVRRKIMVKINIVRNASPTNQGHNSEISS